MNNQKIFDGRNEWNQHEIIDWIVSEVRRKVQASSNDVASLVAKSLARISVGPPAANGTMIRITLSLLDCANASIVKSCSEVKIKIELVIFLIVSSKFTRSLINRVLHQNLVPLYPIFRYLQRLPYQTLLTMMSLHPHPTQQTYR